MYRAIGAVAVWAIIIAQTAMIYGISVKNSEIIRELQQINYILTQMSQGKDV